MLATIKGKKFPHPPTLRGGPLLLPKWEKATALPRRVVAELVRIELEAEQHLEAGAVDRAADRRIGHRIDRRVGVARPALAGNLAAHVLGQGRRGAKHLGGRGGVGAGAE